MRRRSCTRQSSNSGNTIKTHLKPVGNLEVEFIDAAHAVVEGLHGLAGLQMRLCGVSSVLEHKASSAYQHGGILGSRHVVHDGRWWKAQTRNRIL